MADAKSTQVFNLLREPWLPCLSPDGASRELGIRETLARAHELAELRDPSPLVTAALHRLLLALLHRVFGPSSQKEWKKLWDAGRFDTTKLDRYFKKWLDRFDLFDPTHPFFQTGGKVEGNDRGVNVLTPDTSEVNADRMWHHIDEDNPPCWTPAEAARGLIAHQLFSGPGGRGYATAPAVRGVSVLLIGGNLFQTLMLNLVVRAGDQPMPANDHDAPAWEHDTPATEPAAPDGYLDYLTFQVRTVRLRPEPDGRGVRRMLHAAGQMYRLDEDDVRFDPLMAYHNGPPPRAVRLREDRALWRDSATLLQFAEDDPYRPPANLKQASDLVAKNFLADGAQFETAVIGAVIDNAKVKMWRHDHLPLPAAYLADRNVALDLKTALALAEAVGDALRWAVKVAVTARLAPLKGQKPDPERVTAMINSLAAERLYWSRLEAPFRAFLRDLPGEQAHRVGQLRKWFADTLRPMARDAYNATAGDLDRSARTLRAGAEGRRQLEKRLGKIGAEQPFNDPTPTTPIATQENADDR